MAPLLVESSGGAPRREADPAERRRHPAVEGPARQGGARARGEDRCPAPASTGSSPTPRSWRTSFSRRSPTRACRSSDDQAEGIEDLVKRYAGRGQAASGFLRRGHGRAAEAPRRGRPEGPLLRRCRSDPHGGAARSAPPHRNAGSPADGPLLGGILSRPSPARPSTWDRASLEAEFVRVAKDHLPLTGNEAPMVGEAGRALGGPPERRVHRRALGRPREEHDGPRGARAGGRAGAARRRRRGSTGRCPPAPRRRRTCASRRSSSSRSGNERTG